MIAYEWVVETLDEFKDIIDTAQFATFLEADQFSKTIDGPYEVGLIRDVFNNVDSDLEDRQWAYLVNGRLPVEFDGGAKIPKRFYSEAGAV